MPIYEYRCRECGKVTEVFIRSFREKTVMRCPSCKSNNLDKIFSAPAAVISDEPASSGSTCCGRSERCDTPPCSDDKVCRRD